jgi:hypothetical protein
VEGYFNFDAQRDRPNSTLRRGGSERTHVFTCNGPHSAPQGTKEQPRLLPVRVTAARCPREPTSETGRWRLSHMAANPKLRWITHSSPRILVPAAHLMVRTLRVTTRLPGCRSLHCGILADWWPLRAGSAGQTQLWKANPTADELWGFAFHSWVWPADPGLF